MNDVIQNIAVYALPVLFAITLHEAAHAYVARYFGDSTAYLLGRMTLNPFKHIDPFGTIILPLVLSFIPGAPVLGYAKPVPVDFGKLRKPKRDMAWVALAGPLANLFMALIWMLLALALKAGGSQEEYFARVADAGVLTNLVIFAFNLFPVPPLDGGRVLFSLLPHRMAYKFAQIEPYGFFIVLALMAIPGSYFWQLWMLPVMIAGAGAVQIIVFPLTYFLG
jgi:Zn-dependent protease